MQFQAQSKRFAAQKQCFCSKRLSAPNCLLALRFKLEGRLARLRGEKYSNLAQQQTENAARAIFVAIMTYACINTNRKQQNMIYAT